MKFKEHGQLITTTIKREVYIKILNTNLSLFKEAVYAGLLALMLLHLPILSWGQELEIQEEDEQLIYDLNKSIQDQIPPLDILFLTATKNHPSVNYNAELAKAFERKVRIEKKTWTSHLNGFFNYGYGNQALIATGTVESDFVNIANGYRTGVNVNIPLYEFTTRKDRIKWLKQEYEAQLYKTDELALEVHNKVVEHYHDLILSQKVMNLRFDMAEKARQSMTISEREFRVGNMDITNYTRIVEIFTINKTQFEVAKKEFLVALDKLELLVGQPLHMIDMSEFENGGLE